MSIVPLYISSPYNIFLYFLEGQVHKDSKLGIMTNMGKSRLAKVIFTNIHKISDACANSLVDTSWLRNVWEMFLLFIKFKFLWKNGVPEKIKTHLPQHPPALQQLFSPHLLKKFLAPPPFKKEGKNCILYESLQRRDNKVITILFDRFLFTEL